MILMNLMILVILMILPYVPSSLCILTSNHHTEWMVRSTEYQGRVILIGTH